jgi:hypothetical protein
MRNCSWIMHSIQNSIIISPLVPNGGLWLKCLDLGKYMPTFITLLEQIGATRDDFDLVKLLVNGVRQERRVFRIKIISDVIKDQVFNLLKHKVFIPSSYHTMLNDSTVIVHPGGHKGGNKTLTSLQQWRHLIPTIILSLQFFSIMKLSYIGFVKLVKVLNLHLLL